MILLVIFSIKSFILLFSFIRFEFFFNKMVFIFYIDMNLFLFFSMFFHVICCRFVAIGSCVVDN